MTDTIKLFDPDTGATMEVPMDKVITQNKDATQNDSAMICEIERLQKELSESRLIISGKTFDDEVIRLKAERDEALQMVRELRELAGHDKNCSSWLIPYCDCALAKADEFLKRSK